MLNGIGIGVLSFHDMVWLTTFFTAMTESIKDEQVTPINIPLSIDSKNHHSVFGSNGTLLWSLMFDG